MKRLAIFFVFLCMSGAAGAAGDGAQLDKVLIDLNDKPSLQRGAKIFVNFCLSCHSASYMRYNRMGADLGLSDEQIIENLMFTGDKVGDLMETTMPVEDAKKWFGTAPPDLSLTSRSRGADWIYTYLRSFYLDEESPSGWNNTVFENVAMPHALYEWQGSQRAVFTSEEGHDGEAGDKHFDHFEIAIPGKMTPVEYDSAMRDLTNFMVYLGEPAKLVRHKIGAWVLLFLGVLAVLAYLLKKEYWRDIHH